MRQRIGNRPLKQFFQRNLRRLARGQEVVKLLERSEKSLNLLLPRQWFRILPLLPAHGNRQCPVKQIPQMRQNLPRRAHSLAGLKLGEALRRVPHGFRAAIGQRGQGVPQQFPLGIGGRVGMSIPAHGDKTTLDCRRRKAWRKK